VGGQTPADTPMEVTIYELAKRFHALPSQVMNEPAILMRRISTVIEAESTVGKLKKPGLASGNMPPGM